LGANRGFVMPFPFFVRRAIAFNYTLAVRLLPRRPGS
jgi:hypothetical protein